MTSKDTDKTLMMLPGLNRRRRWALLGAAVASTLGAGVLMAGGVGLLGAVVGVASPPGERALAQETLLYFDLQAQQPAVRLALDPGVSVVRLESLLTLPLETTYDPRSIYPYGLAVRLKDDRGNVLMSQEIHLETRLSRAGWEGERWTWANARVRDGSVELADNRLTELPVPGEGLARRELEVIPLGGNYSRVLMRAYAKRHLPEWEVELRLKSLGAHEAESLAEKVSHRTWSQLEPHERRALVSFEWLRLPAEGSEGRDWTAIPVWFYGFSLPDAPRTALARFYLSPWRDAALNVRGPGKLILQRTDALEEVLPEWPVPIEAATDLSIRRVRAQRPDQTLPPDSLADDGWSPEETRRESVAAQSPAADATYDAEPSVNSTEIGLEHCRFAHNGDTCTLSLNDEQLQTLHLQAAGGWLGLRYFLQEGASVGDRAVLPEGDGRLRVQPDVRTLYAYRVDRNLSPLRLGLLDPSGSTISLILRPQVPPPVSMNDPRDDSVPMAVTVTVLDDAGQPLKTSTCGGTVAASRYEFYRDRQGLAVAGSGTALAGEASENSPVESSTWSSFVRVGERTPCQVSYPAGARWMEIASSRPVDVQLLERAPWVEHDAYEPPWSLSSQSLARFRYAPLFRRRWEPIRPADEAALWQAERVTRIAAQVRLEPEARKTPVRLTGGKVLLPEGDPLKQVLLMPRSAGAGAGEGDESTLVSLVPGQETAVWLPGGPVKLLHRLNSAGLGQSFRLLLDGEPLSGQRLQTRLGTLSPGSSPPGLRKLTLEGPAGMWLVEGRPASSGTPVYRREVVYRLTRDNPIAVQMPLQLAMGSAHMSAQDSSSSTIKSIQNKGNEAQSSGSKPRVLNVQVYVPTAGAGGGLSGVVAGSGREPVVLSSRLDEGQPRRLSGREAAAEQGWASANSLTAGVLRRVVSVAGGSSGGLIQDRADGGVAGPVRVVRRLGSDLAPGNHRVEWRLEQGPPVVYLRFFVMDERSVATDETQLSISLAY